VEDQQVDLVNLTRELLPVLKSRPPAKTANTSSGIARLPYPGLAVYGATKAFVSGLGESLSCELHGTHVDVLCFHPGFTETSFMQSAAMDMR
jgi:short-subunit dehydrogenase